MEEMFTSRAIDLLLIIVIGAVIILGIKQEKRITDLETKIKRMEDK